jgi:hypothetical protein
MEATTYEFCHSIKREIYGDLNIFAMQFNDMASELDMEHELVLDLLWELDGV